MRDTLLPFLAACIATAVLTGCGLESEPAAHDHDAHDHDAHDHSAGHLLFSEHAELFVEFEPLIVGQSTGFASHFTDLGDFKPIESGRVTVRMDQGPHALEDSSNETVQAGIFKTALHSKKEGAYNLTITLETERFTDRFLIEDVQVFKHAYAAEQWAHAQEDGADGDATTFTKEQAWKIDFATERVKREAMNEVIRAGGEVLPSRGDEVVVTAQAGGVVIFDLDHTILGEQIAKGDEMFTIASGGLSEHNLETEFLQAQAIWKQAQAEYERKQALFKAQAVAQAELEESELRFELARSEFENISRNYGAQGKRVTAPATGYLKDVLVSAGEYVEPGDAMAVLAQNKKLTLQADVPQSFYPQLRHISTAHFSIDKGPARAISDVGGKLLSYGKSVSRAEPFIPVRFEIDNRGDVLPGAFLEMFISIEESVGEVLSVPNSALLESYGQYLVFVQVGGEKFERREVEIGVTNGVRTEIRQGLAEGERIVSRGAFQVKMAGMSASVPAHGHVH